MASSINKKIIFCFIKRSENVAAIVHFSEQDLNLFSFGKKSQHKKQ